MTNYKPLKRALYALTLTASVTGCRYVMLGEYKIEKSSLNTLHGPMSELGKKYDADGDKKLSREEMERAKSDLELLMDVIRKIETLRETISELTDKS